MTKQRVGRARRATTHARRGLVALLGAVVLAGCATKRDVRDLQAEMIRLEAKQDSLFMALQRQNQILLDTIKASFDLQMDVRGQTSHRFQQLEDNLGRMEALVQQVIASMNQLDARLAEQPRMGAPMGGQAGAPEAAAMYEAAMRLMNDRAYGTARDAFTQIIEDYPQDPIAADAQYQIGETHYAEQAWDEALAALEEVERRWPESPRAPGALLRAGIIAQEQGQDNRARTYYQQVRDRYPASDEAGLAAQRLRAIG